MKRKKLIIVTALVLGSAVFVMISVRPGYIEDDKKATENAIEEFHTRLSAGQLDDIYRDAHNVFQTSQTREGLIAAMQQTKDRFGSFGKVTNSKLNVIIGAPVQIRAVYNTTYEKGDATEMFLFLKEGDNVKLAGYQIYPGTVKPGDGQ